MTWDSRGVAVVSGGGSGIGREAALELARRGHPLALLGRRVEPLRETLAAAGRSPDTDLALACDVRDADAVAAAAAEIERHWGEAGDTGADILVPAAGFARLAPVDQASPADFAEVVATNLNGTFHLIHSLLPGMKRRGRGWIFPLMSVAARRGFPGWGAYCASKWGLAGLVAVLREELAGTGVRLTALYPGATDTPIWNGLPGDWNRGSMVPASEVARALRHALDAPAAALYEEIHLGPSGGAL